MESHCPTLLIADDDGNDLILFERALTTIGTEIRVETVRSGVEVIGYLAGVGNRQRFKIPEVILLDLKMPESNGFEVLEWLRGHPPFNRIRVIVFSSSSEQRDIDRAYDLGACSYFVKPVSYPNLNPIFECLVRWMQVNHFPGTGPDGAATLWCAEFRQH